MQGNNLKIIKHLNTVVLFIRYQLPWLNVFHMISKSFTEMLSVPKMNKANHLFVRLCAHADRCQRVSEQGLLTYSPTGVSKHIMFDSCEFYLF